MAVQPVHQAAAMEVMAPLSHLSFNGRWQQTERADWMGYI
jgi:hypothetical protein